MLDEVDKLSASHQGDPFSALLEVLDPEQNNSFRDNYLAVPFDLSKVLFIGTANVLDAIPPPLRDRMEIIELTGYTEEEKLQIAKRHLLSRQLRANGLNGDQVDISEEALRRLIIDHTREAGVRSLERQIGAVLRDAAVTIAAGQAQRVAIGADDVARILGAPRFESDVALRTSIPGVATGLAWTPAGGDILFIESSRVRGSGKLILTGQLGDVMKESAQAAVTWVKSQADRLKLDPLGLDNSDLHIHVPAGAIPKDGPSAGVAMATSIASLLSQRTVRPDVAMTGEISLRGVVMPVGGIKEKCVAAARAGIPHRDTPRAQSARSGGHPVERSCQARVRLGGEDRRLPGQGRWRKCQARAAGGGLSRALLPGEGTSKPAAAPMTAVAIHPRTMNERLATKAPITDCLETSSMITTMRGTATTPLITALQNKAFMGWMGRY